MAVPSPPVGAPNRPAYIRRRFRRTEIISSLSSTPPSHTAKFMPSLSVQHELNSMYASLGVESWECIHAAVKSFKHGKSLLKYKLAFSCSSKWPSLLQQVLPNLLTEFIASGDGSDEVWIHCAKLALGRPCTRSQSPVTSIRSVFGDDPEEKVNIAMFSEFEASVARRPLRFVSIRRLPTRNEQVQSSSL